MIQICRKDKEKVYEAIRSGKIDAAEMSFPNLIDDILLTLKRRGLTDPYRPKRWLCLDIKR